MSETIKLEYLPNFPGVRTSNSLTNVKTSYPYYITGLQTFLFRDRVDVNVNIYGFVIFEGLFETLIHPAGMKFDLKSGEIIYLGLQKTSLCYWRMDSFGYLCWRRPMRRHPGGWKGWGGHLFRGEPVKLRGGRHGASDGAPTWNEEHPVFVGGTPKKRFIEYI